MKDTFVLCKDRISYTEEMSNEDRGILLDVIMKYQNWIDIWDPPYAVKIVFSHIKRFFEKQQDNYNEICEKNKENVKKRRDKNKEVKPNDTVVYERKKKIRSDTKPYLTDTDTILSTNVDNNNISKDILYNKEKWIKKFWNEEINEIMEIIKKYNDWVINWSDWKQRQFANNLIKKIKQIKSVEEWKYTRQAIIELILNTIKDEPYHNTKISSPELIFYNLASLMNVCKAKFQKNNKSFKEF